MKQTTNKKGFTLIELLIVTFMTAIIATIILSNYKQADRHKAVGLASDGIISALTLAQNYSLSGKSTTNPVATCRIPQYYYVEFAYSGDSYSLYGYNNCNTSDLIETYKLPQNIQVKSSSLIINSSSALNNLRIAFFPPFAKIKAAADGGSYNTFTNSSITVEFKLDNTVNKTVGVDGVSGRIGL